MKLKARTAPREDASLNAIRSLPLPDETANETSPRVAAAGRHADTGASSKNTRFTCDGRNRCSQMTSCEEATFFLQNCPNQETDGDHDGVPCEDQWCQ
ncbi:MAG: excalibur calcium-binding domain-containing protein [Methylobacter sp.]|uniref:excalibur calcium-binding domain-containing protein n=1 Tax=Methylobacter sp. TaxID=2051955 RepID=UPI002585014F|nr:excalibur calcium-binding domain-containing protein [Methylobacter sp.]MCL7422837.1 excalibur calcium-binding domain-containing protein [Methylobacter sp.]